MGFKNIFMIREKIKTEVNYENGILEGEFVKYYRNGKKQEKSHYQNGVKDGISFWFFENESISIEYPYAKGEINGVAKTYYNDGTLKTESAYLNNELNGQKKEYFLSKKLKSKGYYKDGKKEGKWYTYNEDGSVSKVSRYKNGFKKVKKIGIVCYPTFGGSGIVATELGKALSEKKYFVHFISYEKPVRLDSLKKNFSFHKVKIPLYPLFHYPPYELALTAKIVEVVERNKLDLLHVHYAVPHAYAAVNAKRILKSRGVNIPIVTTLHGTDITLVGRSPFVLSAVNYAINESDSITAVSNYLKKETLKNFDIKKEINVIPNFIDFSHSILDFKKASKSP